MPESTVKPDRRALLNAYLFPRWITPISRKKGTFPGGFFMAIQQKGWMHQIHSRFEKRNASQAEAVVSR
jgi:hypothetical protein